MDSGGFMALLAARFGPPVTTPHLGAVFAIKDGATGVTFEAFVSAEGPSYGGARKECYEDVAAGDLRLKEDVIRSLSEFEAWLTGEAN